MTAATLRATLAQVSEAAIAAVQPRRLLPQRLACRAGELLLDGAAFAEPVRFHDRVLVVGGGKAAAGMAAAVETVLAPAIAAGVLVRGLVGVPEGCGLSLPHVEVRETRPSGANVPTASVVESTRAMRGMLASLHPDDLAIVVVTGGGSALLEDPAPGLTLDDVLAVTRGLAAAGAGIRELNVVRQTLSLAKAGGLARSCTAGRLVTLVLSDVIGDPLDLIASGPCMPVLPDPQAARAILHRHRMTAIPPAVMRHLEQAAAPAAAGGPVTAGEWTTPGACRVSHVLLGSNDTAADAAARSAADLGYEVTIRHASTTHETADDVGRRMASEAFELSTAVSGDGRPRAVIEGGEAVVAVPSDHGVGGRNQQTVLVAADAWRRSGRPWPAGLVVASLGTDGEDGPTDAAGGMVDAAVASRLGDDDERSRTIRRCDAHPLLAAAGGLIRTGPTGTNVADVRIILARP